MDALHRLNSFEDYLAYFLLYASYADYECSLKEKEKIMEICGKKAYRRAKNLFEKLTDFGQLRFILDNHRKFIQNEMQEEKLQKSTRSLFEADGEYSMPENSFLRFISRLLQSG